MQFYVPLKVPSMVVSGIDIHSNLTISTRCHLITCMHEPESCASRSDNKVENCVFPLVA